MSQSRRMRIEERRRQLDSGGDGRWRSRIRGGAADGRRQGRTPPEDLGESEGCVLGLWACALRLRYRRYARHRTAGSWQVEVGGRQQWRGGLPRSQSQVKVRGHGSRVRRRTSAVRRRIGCRNSVCWISDIPRCPGSCETSMTSGQATGVRTVGGASNRRTKHTDSLRFRRLLS